MYCRVDESYLSNRELQFGHLSSIIHLILCYLPTMDHVDDVWPKKLSWRRFPKLFHMLFFIVCPLLSFGWIVNFQFKAFMVIPHWYYYYLFTVLYRLILVCGNHNFTILWDSQDNNVYANFLTKSVANSFFMCSVNNLVSVIS